MNRLYTFWNIRHSTAPKYDICKTTYSLLVCVCVSVGRGSFKGTVCSIKYLALIRKEQFLDLVLHQKMFTDLEIILALVPFVSYD